ncbi:hypothetical protein [Cellulosimicrobium sp. SJTW-1]|uniref:hypothetical protein n=1 Tax=Cellulosimicrobium sp. SJTW-1 TaxID=3078082 RepID=UPI0039E74206
MEGVVLESAKALLQSNRDDKLRMTGSTRIAELDPVGADLTNTQPDGTRTPTAEFEVCLDVSDADLVDASGASVLGEDQPTTGWEHAIVINRQWDEDLAGGWVVTTLRTMEKAPCGGDG